MKISPNTEYTIYIYFYISQRPPSNPLNVTTVNSVFTNFIKIFITFEVIYDNNSELLKQAKYGYSIPNGILYHWTFTYRFL